MTLNGHFTLNLRYYEQRFQKQCYIHRPTVTPIYRIFLLYHMTSKQRHAEAVLDPQNI